MSQAQDTSQGSPVQVEEELQVFKTGKWRVIFWIALPGGMNAWYEDNFYKEAKKGDSAYEIAKELAKLPYVSAVEVIDRKSKHGNVIYNNWPDGTKP